MITITHIFGDILSNIAGSKGERVLLTGDEAIARGILESGIKFITGYPGTPASEIVDELASIARQYGLYVEWSVNEKVGFEVAYASSLAGVGSAFVCKHLGLNWIMDPWIVASETGVNAPLLIVTGDDVHPYASQNAQDTRFLARVAKSPMVEPSTIQEAKDIVKLAADVSRRLELPVVVRATLRICHSRGVVELGDVPGGTFKGFFKPDKERYVMIASKVRRRLPLLNRKFYYDAVKIAEEFPLNKVIYSDNAELGVIAVGLSFAYAWEAVEMLGLRDKVSFLKLAWHLPPPRELISKFLSDHSRVLVLEEVDPFLENEVKSIAYDVGARVRIFGKYSGHIPFEGELNTGIVARAIARITGCYREVEMSALSNGGAPVNNLSDLVIRRIPYLCPGCPHRASYYSIKQAVKSLGLKAIVTGDRGCYNQGVHPPLEAIDTCICMGASIAMAHGFSKSRVDDVVIAVIGDSTFFHAGLPALVNAVYNGSKILVAVFDNRWTAMTGLQPNPSTGVNAMREPARRFYPEELAKAIGVDYVRTVDPYDVKASVDEVVKAIEYIRSEGKPAVLVFRRPCIIQEAREWRRKGVKPTPYIVNWDRCTGCRYCIVSLGCPALEFNEERRKVSINEDKCVGCGVCAQVCPADAIAPKRGE